MNIDECKDVFGDVVGNQVFLLRKYSEENQQKPAGEPKLDKDEKAQRDQTIAILTWVVSCGVIATLVATGL